MNFRSRDFLTAHSREILDFYLRAGRDERGGYFQNYYDDGRVFAHGDKHLVSSCRMTFNFYQAHQFLDARNEEERAQWLAWAEHGLAYLREAHKRVDAPGYVWTFKDYQPADQRQYCYGYAFLILAFASAVSAGEESAREDLYAAWDLMEKHFWQPQQGLYADEISADWSQVSDYRGQNANMHACEAMIAAYEATSDSRFLARSIELAEKVVLALGGKSDGLVWEHFTLGLDIDWDYNKDDPKNLYKPWGFQPGHQTEWTKLLLMLARHSDLPWLAAKARELFDRAMEAAWDDRHGGLYYGFAPDQSICDDDKYFWVQAESFAAAALLGEATGDEGYWRWYERLWEYSWTHFVDHDHGAWYRILNADNSKVTDKKSEAGAKCDYHSLNACLETLRVLRASSI
ncbi:AGE family epimerase/isomerase [Hahella sp. CR1]|uniref:AGE family epimerase/isomerase n=1 Tax=Hahella sp. CR1 TaxID=2992807 RepID=UPI002442EFF3|nr:AGE family epimerase/isomerase [Hahella sp. CR1]MDG9670255.1 AGE family epimerase/isomerase [Hahella sp. CR1]